MTTLAMFSDKGSPGVTTTCLALAGVWPRPCVLVEADPAGDLVLRLVDAAGRPLLASEPSVLTLAAAVRRDPATALTAHSQQAFCGAAVVAGAATPQQARGMAPLWPTLDTTIRCAQADVILDCGRLTPESPVAALAAHADVLVGVVRADAAAMLRMRDRLADLLDHLPANPARRVRVVLLARQRQVSEAAEAMRRVLADGVVPAEVAGTVVVDPRAVAALHGIGSGARLERWPFGRSIRDVAARLSGSEQPPAVPGPRRILTWSR